MNRVFFVLLSLAMFFGVALRAPANEEFGIAFAQAAELELPKALFKEFKIEKVLLVRQEITGGEVCTVKLVTGRVSPRRYGLLKIVQDCRKAFQGEGWRVEEHEDSRTGWETRFRKGHRLCLVTYTLLREDTMDEDPRGGHLVIYLK